MKNLPIWLKWGLPLTASIVLLLATLTPPVWQLQSMPPSKEMEKTLNINIDSRDWLPLASISRHTIHAFVTAEDAKFYDHKGIDADAIWKSFLLNWKHQKIIRGASTITQQVVKLSLLSQEKTFLRKMKEVLGALVLERLLTKDEILEWYLNLVPLGQGNQGIKAAARFYFNEQTEMLTVQNSIQLAIILPRPSERSSLVKNKRLTPFGHKRFYQIANDMYDYGYLSKSLKHNALTTGDFGEPIRVKPN